MTAAPGAVVGTAVLQVIPSMKGGVKSLEKELGGTGTAAGKKFSGGFEKATKGIGSKIGGILKGGAIGAGAAALGGIGVSLNNGFKRLDNIDQAQAKLKGLGHDTKSVDKIMENAMASVKGTAFGLGDAATVAATTVAAGIKPGKELERTLKIIGDSATIAGVGMDEMGSIFNKAAAGGKLTTETMQQMQERGIPVMQFLSKETGKSVAEVQKSLSAGEIDFETFQTAMEKNLGGAAQESGNTFSGAMANVKAALGRVGAAFLGPLFTSGPGLLTKLTGAFDTLTPIAEVMGTKVGSALSRIGKFGKDLFNNLGGVERLKSIFTEASGGVKAFVGAFKAGGDDVTSSGFAGVLERVGLAARKGFDAASGALDVVMPHVKTFGKQMLALWPTVKSLASSVGSFLVSAFKAAQPYLKTAAQIIGVALVAAMKILPPVLKKAMEGFKKVLDTVKPLLPVIASLALSVGVYMGVMKVAALMKFTKALKMQTLATKAAAAAQRLMNLVMRLNPIGLIVTAVMVLVGTLIYLYKNNEKVRKFIDAAWAKIKDAISSVADWFTKTAWPALKKAFAAVGNAALWLWNKGIKPAFSGIGKVISWWYNNIVKRYFTLVGNVFKTLAGVAKWLWKNGIKPAFEGIGKVASWLWNNAIKPAFGFIKRGAQGLVTKFTEVRDGIKTAWNKVRSMVESPIRLAVDWVKKKALQIADGFITTRDRLKRGWDRVKAMVETPIRAAVDWVKKKANQVATGFNIVRDRVNRGWARIKEMVMKPIRAAVDWVKTKANQVATGFGIVRDRVKTAWDKAKEIVKSPIRDGVDWVKTKIGQIKTKFADIRDGIGTVWDKLESKIKSPIKKALTWINDNLIAKVNVVLEKVKVKKIPEIPGFASGGWTGRGSKYQPAGVVHADEYVVNKASRRKFESDNPGVLDHINRTGKMPGYYMGGKVKGLNKDFLSRLSQWNQFHGNKYMVNSGYRSIEEQTRLWNNSDKSGRMVARPGGSNHNFGIAADLSPQTSVIARESAGRYGLKFPMSWEPWHIEPIGIGKDGLAGTALDKGWDSIEGWIKKSKLPLLGQQMWEKGKSALSDFIKNRIPNIGEKYGKFGQMAFGMVKRSFGNINTDFREGLMGQYSESKATARDAYTQMRDIMPGGGVERWRSTVLNALSIMGLSDKYANSTLRRMNQESGGNPRALNDWDINAKRGDPSKGLMQVIGSTFRAYAHPDYNKDIYDPLSNILASMRYAQARYGTLWAAYDRKGGYAEGGLVKPLLFDSGGYLPPGVSTVVNKTGKPEPLKRMDGAETPNITVYVQSPWGPQYMESKVRDVVNEEDNYASTLRRMN